ncbi:MAG: transcriptional regulator [Ferrovibrio sp.]|uniref:transcriptional regulator n=1 Tax=Ferrovibrio sp. TaxID=1917215 RepID=UPI003918C977
MEDFTGCDWTDRGPFTQVRGGRNFFPLDPRPNEVFIDDIAEALAKQCRYNGHCKPFYSVAQHSVLVSLVVPPKHALAGLMHDAAEAYIGDTVRPLKMVLEKAAPGVLRGIADRIDRAIAERFLIPPAPFEVIKHADNTVLATEKRDLMEEGGDWGPLPEPLPVRIVPLTWEAAKEQFLQRFRQLGGHAFA